jgi:hypothetical protein
MRYIINSPFINGELRRIIFSLSLLNSLSTVGEQKAEGTTEEIRIYCQA